MANLFPISMYRSHPCLTARLSFTLKLPCRSRKKFTLRFDDGSKKTVIYSQNVMLGDIFAKVARERGIREEDMIAVLPDQTVLSSLKVPLGDLRGVDHIFFFRREPEKPATIAAGTEN